jgi:nucleotide-binding universal stress UspA family protein
MSYKTILVHVDKSRGAAERIKLAAMIAAKQNARLVGVALTGISRFIYQAGLINDNDPNLTTHLSAQLDMLRNRAEEALEEFAQLAQKLNVRAFETELIDDEAGDGVTLRARCNDLVVIGQTDLDEPSPAVAPDFPEVVVMDTGRPVLIVPYAGRFDSVGNRVLIAWDGSIGATRAVANALPLLKSADAVDVAVFNPESVGDPDQQPGADIAAYLAHHGVHANVVRQKIDISIGDALLSMATDLNSDLMVMGAYGRSRFREMLLGGVTRTVLQSMTVPVLMSN